MVFLKKELGKKEQTGAAGAGGEDFVAALSMHVEGEVEPALAAYRAIAAAVADDNLASFFAAAIEAGNGKIAEAVETLRAISRRSASAKESMSRSLSLELTAQIGHHSTISVHDVADLVETFGDLLKEKGFVQEAAVCFEIAAGLVPDLADVHYKLGDALHDLGLYEYAETVLQHAVQIAPNHWGAVYTYAVLLQDLGRNEEALPYYEKVVALNPDHANCRNNYGAALFRTDRLAEALHHCTEAEKLAPASPFVRINLGNIFLLMNDLEKSRESFQQAISLQPGIPMAYYGLASVEERLGSAPERIAELYRAALKAVPSFAPAHHALGNLLAAAGDAAALDHFAAAVQIADTLQNLHRDYGIACLKLGRREEGLNHLRIAQLQDPTDATIQECLAGSAAKNQG